MTDSGRLIFIFGLLLTLQYGSVAQRHLYLSKSSSNFRQHIYKDDFIKFRLDGEKYFNAGTIESFTDSSFFVFETEVLISEIDAIDLRSQNTSWWSFGSAPGKIIFAGLALPLIDLLNEGSGPSPTIWIVSGSLVLSGILMKLISKKYFYPKKPKCKIEIIG